MSYEPVLDGGSVTNVDAEHVYKLRVTFGSNSAVTFRSKDATIAKTTTTTFTVTLPKPYNEITDFSAGWKQNTGLAAIITTDSVASAGTLVLTTVSTTSGSATAPSSGDVMYITLGVSCSLVNNMYTG